MKILTRLIVCLILLSNSSEIFALGLEAKDVLLINSISRFIDLKPEGKAIKSLEMALKSENPCVKGLGALILYKHFGRQFSRVFLTSFTLNTKVDNFDRQERKLMMMEGVNQVLADLETSLVRIFDDRVRRIFLFYHFRHIDLWLVGQSGEKLSLAVFYRISSLDSVFGPAIDAIKLAAKADGKTE